MTFRAKRIAALTLCLAVAGATAAEASDSNATGAAVAAGAEQAAKRVQVKCHKVRRSSGTRFKCSIPANSLPDGPRGPQGATGPAGAIGTPGTNGSTGATGQTGATGVQGPAVALATATDSSSSLGANFTATPATVLSTTISPAAPAKLLISASVSVDATAIGNSGVRCQIYLDGVPFGAASDTVVAPLLSPGEATVSLDFLTGGVSASSRTVEVRCAQVDGGGSAAALGRSLTVLALAG